MQRVARCARLAAAPLAAATAVVQAERVRRGDLGFDVTRESDLHRMVDGAPASLRAVTQSDAEHVASAAILPPRPDLEHYKVVQVVLLHRHGDRAPISRGIGSHSLTEEDTAFWASKLPDERHMERLGREIPVETRMGDEERTRHDRTSTPYGQLTARGAAQMHALGRALRRHYVDTLGVLPADAPSAVYARSTFLSRTIYSLRHLLDGLYPDAHRGAGGGFVVHVEHPDHDVQFSRSCAALQASLDKLRALPHTANARRIAEVEATVARELEEGEAEEDARQAQEERQEGEARQKHPIRALYAHELGKCLHAHGRPLPPVLARHLAQLGAAAATDFSARAASAPLARLSIGRVVGYVMDEAVARARGVRAEDAEAAEETEEEAAWAAERGLSESGPGHRLALLSGHDTTIIPMLAALGVFDGRWPEYAAYIELLLLQDRDCGALSVRVAYKGRVVKQLPLREFIRTMRPLVPRDYERECRGEPDEVQ